MQGLCSKSPQNLPLGLLPSLLGQSLVVAFSTHLIVPITLLIVITTLLITFPTRIATTTPCSPILSLRGSSSLPPPSLLPSPRSSSSLVLCSCHSRSKGEAQFTDLLIVQRQDSLRAVSLKFASCTKAILDTLSCIHDVSKIALVQEANLSDTA